MSLLFGLLVVPSAVQAQMGRFRNAPAMTANGPVYNPTQTPEWRQAGGNYAVWEQIMMNKMAAAEQAAFQKQMVAYQKMMKAQGVKPGMTPTNDQSTMNFAPQQRRLKKKPTLKPSSVTKPKDEKKGDKATKPDAETDEEVAPPATVATPVAAKPADKVK